MKTEKSWLTNKVIFVTFLFIGFIAYGLSLGNGFVGDDKSLLVDNNVAHSISNIRTFLTGGAFNSGGAVKLAGFYYKPTLLVVLSNWYGIFGPNPGAFHGLQVFIHVVNSFLVFCLFKRFFPRGLAFGLGALFLVHPANVEAVIYVSGIQEPIFLFFGLIAILGRIYFPINLRSNILVGGALLLTILSKETGILFAAGIIFYDFLFEKRPALAADGKVLGAVAIIYGFLRFGLAGVFFSNQHVAPIMALGLPERLLSMPKILLMNLQTIFFPIELAFAQTWVVKSVSFQDFWLPIIVSCTFAIFFIGLGYRIWKQKKYFKEFMFFGVWGLLGIGMHLQIIPLDGTFSERWLYLPLVAFLGIVGIVIEKWFLTKKTLKLVLAVFLVVMVVFVYRDVTRVQEWKTQFSLYSADSEKKGGSFILHNGLAQEYVDKKNFSLAEKYANKSVTVFPTFLNWNNLGVIYSKTGRYDEAIQALKKSLAFGPYYLAYENIIGTYLLWGKYDEATKTAEEAMKYFPGNSKLWVFWSVAKYRQGDKQAALAGAQRALQMGQSAEAQYLWQTINAGTEVNLGN